jgi:flavin-dependent dehydrogenase
VSEDLRRLQKKFSSSNIHQVMRTIPIGIRSRACSAGCIIAGDAAGFPKPISGEGICTGVRSAYHVASVAITACESGDSLDTTLSEYGKRWCADFGGELELGFKAFVLRRMLTAEEIDATIDALNTPEILALIAKSGDMDHSFSLLIKLMKKQHLSKFFGFPE